MLFYVKSGGKLLMKTTLTILTDYLKRIPCAEVLDNH